jgi:5-formyltetrahydrofolate cyclo-ligase
MPARKSATPRPAARKSAAPPASKKPAATTPRAKGSKKTGKKSSVRTKPSPKKVPAKKAPTSEPKPAARMALRELKVVVRRQMREGLAKMRERGRRSKEICKAIVNHPSWRRATIVAIFAPMESEPDVELLWKEAAGKTICYPAIRLGGLDFISVGGPESVVVGPFGIREPVFDQARVIPPDTFDLVLVPGAAFTANGDRLGRGGGFYDRLLSTPGFRAFKIGVCFDRQILKEVPTEPHDQRVHRVVTENGWQPRPDFVKAAAR